MEILKEYHLKQDFRWARGKVNDRIRGLWDANKGIHYNYIKQIKPRDICQEDSNCTKMAIENPRFASRKE